MEELSTKSRDHLKIKVLRCSNNALIRPKRTYSSKLWNIKTLGLPELTKKRTQNLKFLFPNSSRVQALKDNNRWQVQLDCKFSQIWWRASLKYQQFRLPRRDRKAKRPFQNSWLQNLQDKRNIWGREILIRENHKQRRRLVAKVPQYRSLN